tara:strand:- start:69 stop:1097 length:1029 start_codon:yes stop_codon:yes gene_type:complete
MEAVASREAGSPKKKQKAGSSTGAGKRKAEAENSDSDSECFFPKDDSQMDVAIGPLLAAGMGMNEKKPTKQPVKNEETEDHEYIREKCVVPSECLLNFAQVVGARAARIFAEQYVPVATGAGRAVSGLLLFGPSGTGKSLVAQAICSHIGGTFYRFSAADLPTGKAGAQRIDALFDVAMSGQLPAVIFIDECDGILRASAPQRVGHFAGRFERFVDNLLVIGATNEPDKIAPKILTGRFERKIFMDNPDSAARRALILRQLAEEDEDHMLDPQDMSDIVLMTAGRSAVNMERLVSSAAMHAGGVPVSLADFEAALGEEPSDFDKVTASKNAKFDRAHGWHPL